MKKLFLVLILSFFCSGMLSAANMYDYRGNKNTKVYHYRTCKYFNRLSNYEEFSTAREAENKGYRACGICHPDRIVKKVNNTNQMMLASKGERNAT